MQEKLEAMYQKNRQGLVLVTQLSDEDHAVRTRAEQGLQSLLRENMSNLEIMRKASIEIDTDFKRLAGHLQPYAGEVGDNEGASDVLLRLLGELSDYRKKAAIASDAAKATAGSETAGSETAGEVTERPVTGKVAGKHEAVSA